MYSNAQLCLGIQDLLDNANIADPAQIEAYQMYRYVYVSRLMAKTPLAESADRQK